LATRGDRRRPRLRAVAGLLALIGVALVVGFEAAVVLLPPSDAGGAPPGPVESRAPESATPGLARATVSPSSKPSPSPTIGAPSSPTIAQLVGQKLAIRMDGTTPSAALLGRIRRGEVGAVVLFGKNFVDEAGLIALTTTLHSAARDGGQPPLLLMIDQEGGRIRRLPWAPPDTSATAMGRSLDADAVEAVGAATADALRRDGINVDLAPVEDVPGSGSVTGFMAAADRTFAMDAPTVSQLATAFARGLESRGVSATLKHFPGLGRVRQNTDKFVEKVGASRAQLDRDLAPFRAGIAAGMPIVMLSNATYLALDDVNAAGWSEVVGTQLLRGELGFTGVTITDSLTGAAKARGTTPEALAARAAEAGTDMLMLTGSEAETAGAFDYLGTRAGSGSIPLAALDASYARILALKATIKP